MEEYLITSSALILNSITWHSVSRSRECVIETSINLTDNFFLMDFFSQKKKKVIDLIELSRNMSNLASPLSIIKADKKRQKKKDNNPM